MRFEPAEPSASSGRPSRSTTVGAIMLGTRAPGSCWWKPSGFRSCSPSMLFRCSPVPGTTTPEHEPFEQVTVAQPPSASITEMCVVDPSRERTSVATVSSASSARKLLEVALGCPGPSRKSASRARLVEAITSAIVRRVARPLQPLEDAERVGDQDAARRRRRVGEHLAAVVAHPRRARAPRPGSGARSSARQQAAALEHPVADGGGQRRPRRGSPGPRRRGARAGRPARAAGSCRPRAAAALRARRSPRTSGVERRIGSEHLEQEAPASARPRRPRAPRAAGRSAQVGERQRAEARAAPRPARAWCRRRRTTRARR